LFAFEGKGPCCENEYNICIAGWLCLHPFEVIDFPQKKTKKGKKEKKPEWLAAGDKMQDCPGYQRFHLD